MNHKGLIDVDGVLADFVGGALGLHEMKHNPYDLPENKGRYCLEDMCGISKATFFDSMGYEFWANLDPMPEGPAIVESCIERFGKGNVCFLTSPILTKGCVEGKRSWLRKHYPRIPFLIGGDKRFCAAPHHYLIDDSDKNYDHFTAEGGQAFLVPRPWNREHGESGSVVTRLRRWLGL